MSSPARKLVDKLERGNTSSVDDGHTILETTEELASETPYPETTDKTECKQSHISRVAAKIERGKKSIKSAIKGNTSDLDDGNSILVITEESAPQSNCAVSTDKTEYKQSHISKVASKLERGKISIATAFSGSFSSLQKEAPSITECPEGDGRNTYHQDPLNKIETIQNEIADTMIVLDLAVNSMVLRGENLERVSERADTLAVRSTEFKMKTVEVKRQTCLENLKMKIIIGVVICVILGIIIAVILALTIDSKSKSNTNDEETPAPVPKMLGIIINRS